MGSSSTRARSSDTSHGRRGPASTCSTAARGRAWPGWCRTSRARGGDRRRLGERVGSSTRTSCCTPSTRRRPTTPERGPGSTGRSPNGSRSGSRGPCSWRSCAWARTPPCSRARSPSRRRPTWSGPGSPSRRPRSSSRRPATPTCWPGSSPRPAPRPTSSATRTSRPWRSSTTPCWSRSTTTSGGSRAARRESAGLTGGGALPARAPRPQPAGPAAAPRRARIVRACEQHRSLPAPRHGRHPPRRRNVVPGLGPARGGRLRHRNVRRLGRRPGPAPARRRRVDRDVVRGRPRRRARRRVPLHDPHGRRRRVAPGPVRATPHELGRQRHRLRPRRLRLGRRRVPDPDVGRPRDLRDARRHVRGHGGPARHVRRRPPAPRLPRAARRVRRPGDAAVRVRGRHLVGLQPGPPLRHRVRLRRARRLQAVRARRPRPRHRRHRRRRLQPPRAVRPRPLAVRRLGGGRRRRDLLLQRQPSRDPVGRHPPGLRARRGPVRSCATAR